MSNNYRDKIYKVYTSTSMRVEPEEINQDYLMRGYTIYNGYFKRHIPKDKSKRILDVGCGHGGFVNYLQQNGYVNSFGVDTSEEQIKVGERLKIKNLEKGDAFEYLRKHENSFDFISLLDVLEHFDKDEIMEILEVVNGALAKDGKILIRTINGESPLHGKLRYGDLTHEIAFTTESMEQILEICNFDSFSFFPIEPAVHGIKSFGRAILWKVIKLFLRFYLLVETGSLGDGILTQNFVTVAKKK